MIEQITVNPINESLFSADFIKGFRCGAKRQFQADVEEIAKAKFGRPTGEWIWSPKDKDGTVSGCCSNCSFSHLFIGGHTAQYNYCPNCGAKMKGGTE